MKVVFITGASSGIGFDAARLLAREGNKVYAAARRVELMEPLKDDGVVPMRMDVTDPESVETAVSTVLEAEGRIDVLVNNAGFGYFGAIETVPIEDARNQLDVNLFGLADLCRRVLPSMRENGGGRIVNVSSIAGKAVLYFGGWYHVSKYAVEAFSDALRIEMKPFGVDVVLIEPGGIHTAWGTIAADHLEESSAGTAYSVPAGVEAGVLRKAYTSSILPGPEVVAKAIVKAVSAGHPRTRYRIGLGSSSMLFLHTILPDRWWDSIARLAASPTVLRLASRL